MVEYKEIIQDNDIFTVRIGRNAKDNDKLIKDSEYEDMWFHLEDISGPHIVINNGGKTLTKESLKYIGGLFREYKTGLHKKYKVIYTEIKNITSTKTIGQVNCKNTRIITI
jgi:predicted ribosome quality control (RQC) complex YloA/Tae2 family protein